jgi:hypothetical protein
LPGGAEIPLPYGLLARLIPFVEITRSVSRLSVMVMLAAGVLAALGLQVIGRQRPRVATTAGVAALALALFEFWPAPYPMSPPDTPAWYAELARAPEREAVLNLPMNWDRPGYLLYQTVHGKPLTTAYISRDDPRTLTERAPVLQHFRRLGPDIVSLDLVSQGAGVLRDLGVGWVVLDRYKMPGGEERVYTEATAAEIFGAAPPLYRDDRITVYRVPPSGSAAPYAILGTGWRPFDSERGTRTFTGSALVIVQAPVAGAWTLEVTTAPGSAALAGEAERPGHYILPLELQAGSNPVTLHAAAPGQTIIVSELAIK